MDKKAARWYPLMGEMFRQVICQGNLVRGALLSTSDYVPYNMRELIGIRGLQDQRDLQAKYVITSGGEYDYGLGSKN